MKTWKFELEGKGAILRGMQIISMLQKVGGKLESEFGPEVDGYGGAPEWEVHTVTLPDGSYCRFEIGDKTPMEVGGMFWMSIAPSAIRSSGLCPEFPKREAA